MSISFLSNNPAEGSHVPPGGPEDGASRSVLGANAIQQVLFDIRPPAPFAWQHGTRLILLDEEDAGWVMAELRFEPEACRYAEVRRSVYDSAREAIGAVISRALASGEHAAVDSSMSLHSWLHTYYGISVVGDTLQSPGAKSVEFTV